MIANGTGQSKAQIIDGKLVGADFAMDPVLRQVMDCLNGDGEETRIAGGAVRNALLHQPVRDVDLATTALPDIVMERARLAGMKTIKTGIEHGTVTIVIQGQTFEVTTLREDIQTNGRHAVVRFGRDFAADAMRRDFTINALFLDIDNTLHDYVDGLADIKTRRVRFIGDPHQRIAEDYLRILRLFRIHATYGHGAIDRDGLQASIAGRHGMLGLSKERIGAEIKKLLEASGAASAATEMADAGLLGLLLAGVPNPMKLRALSSVEQTHQLPADVTLRLVALATLVSEDVERLRDLLRLSNAQSARMKQALAAHQIIRYLNAPPPKTDLYRFLFQHGRRAALDALLLSQAGTTNTDPTAASVAEWRSAFAFLRDTPEPRLPFTGTDLIERGVKSGPALGATLKRLQAAWIRAGFPKQPEVLARLLNDALRS